jgi:DNA invertase Pin-like site-specific DNA recombinase
MSDHPFSSGDHVVAYLRDSGHENQELSIERQEGSIREFCIQHGLVLDRSYKDEARQGSSDVKREKLAEMMHDLRRGLDVAGVIVWSNSRFARNSVHAQFYRAEIRKLGYIFHSLTGKTVDGPEAVIFEALDDYTNERYLTNLSIDVKDGLRKLVRDYKCVPGTPPTGFLREQVIIGQRRDGKQRIAHKWVPDPLVIPRIQEAYAMRAVGLSLSDINTRTHLFNSLNSYRTFFANQIYTGTLAFGDLVVENYCDPIVDQALWDKVQEIQNNFTRHRNLAGGSPLHPRRINSNYLLSGLAYCARCDSPLFGRSHPQKNGTKTLSYYCTGAYNKRDCTKHRIPGALVENAVLSALKEKWLKHPAYLEAAKLDLEAQNDDRLAAYLAQRKQVTGELGEVRRQITNLSNAIAESGHSRALLARLTDLEIQETSQLNKLAGLEALKVSEIPPVDYDRIPQILELLDNVFPTADIQLQRRILRTLVKRVDVDRDGRRIFGVLTVYYPPGDDDSPPEAMPPTGNQSSGGQNVRLYRDPSGPPRYTHSFEFDIKLNGLSGRYKNSHS